MILVDSSVWIDFFRGTQSSKTRILKQLFQSTEVSIGDLILTEVLQGFTRDAHFKEAKRLLADFEVIAISDPDIAIAAANNYRSLRKLGFTVRKTIDTLIATRCIKDDLQLLHSDSDFDVFEKHLGLRVLR
jgi:predicted nucleic acid-binding protein